NIPVTNCAAVTGGLVTTKTVDRSSAVFGDSVTYTISIRNDTATSVFDAEIIDRLPPQLRYTPGTALLDGVAAEPAVSGGGLAWIGSARAAGDSIALTSRARIIATDFHGDAVNRAWIEDNGEIVSSIGTATVRIEPEHVFSCSDVIGKVFDDRNRNGYPDP